MATVIVVEPHALLRFGILQHLIDVFPESLIQGVDYSSLSGQTSAKVESDLVLLSVAVHEDAVELANAAQRTYTPKRMLLLSDHATMPGTWRDLPPVVAGYVPKSASPDVLVASIRLVLVGGRCFQSLLSVPGPKAMGPRAVANNSKAIKAWPLNVRHESDLPPDTIMKAAVPSVSLANIEAKMLRITPRQYEVLVLLARGYPIKTVSRQLNISVATAKAHTETLYQRLDAHNRNQAVYTAVSRGATLGWQQLGPYNIQESLHRR